MNDLLIKALITVMIIKVYKERGINVNDDRARDEKRCVGMLFKTWNMGGNHFVWWN